MSHQLRRRLIVHLPEAGDDALGAGIHKRASQSDQPLSFDLLAERCLAGAEDHEIRIEPAIEGADVVMMLRIQRERLGGALFPTLREYARVYGLNQRRLALAKPDALVMHPGPMNRGVEIADDVADGSQSVILDQVEAGVSVRMAVLYHAASEAGTDVQSATAP